MNGYDELHPLLRQQTEMWKVDTNHPLKEFLQQVHPTFFFAGEYNSHATKRIFIKTVKDEKTVYVDAGTINTPEVEILLQAAKPSSFGKGTETVYDETIRKGKELTADDVVISLMVNAGQDPPELNLGIDILPQLPPIMLDRPLKAKFYKLAIYEPGGHFHTHRDTVHGPDHIATLLVEVRSAHKGGDLIVEKDGERHVWSTTTSEPNERLGNKVQWCMFFTDIEHRVEPVLEGVRMVLQYDIFLSDDQDDTIVPRQPFFRRRKNDIISWSSPIQELPHAGATNPEAIMKIVNYLNLHLNSSEAIAIPFFYFYANQKIAPRHLKNADAMLFGELVKAGLSVALTPVQLHAKTDFEQLYRDLPILMEIAGYPLVFYGPIESVGDEAATEDERALKILSSLPREMSLTYVHSGMESSRFLSTEVFQSTVGNEPIHEGENHYFTGAMIIIKEAAVMMGKEKKRKTDEEDKEKIAKRSHQSNDTCEGSLSDQGK